MTRPCAGHDPLDELPSWPRPLLHELRQAPELAVLAALHATLRAGLVALAAEHPSLGDLEPPGEPPTVLLARRLVGAALVLGAALDDYRRTVLAAFTARRPFDDDSPF